MEGNDDKIHEPGPLRQWEFWREVWRGKSPSRILMNFEIRERVRLNGRVVDLGSGVSPSYWRFLDASNIELVKVDFPDAGRPHVGASLENPLPFHDNLFDVALLFNVLEHIYACEQLLTEVHRILKPGGLLYLFVPLLAQIHPDPYDYRRFTSIALGRMFADAGFSSWTVVPLGRACLSIVAAAYPLLFSRLLRIPALIIAGLGDILLERMSARHPVWHFNLWAIGYFACVRK